MLTAHFTIFYFLIHLTLEITLLNISLSVVCLKTFAVYNTSSFYTPHMLFKLFRFCTLYSFSFFFFVHCIHFPFFSMMSCHVVSLISKAFLLFRDTFDDRSVVTSYFLFVLAWLLPSSIHSWFIKLLIILHSGFKS